MGYFGGFMPTVGETAEAYIPWALLCSFLTAVCILQVVICRRVNRYFLRAMEGQNKAGRVLFERLNNAEWNERIRAYCKSHSLIIVSRDDPQHAERVATDQM